jgi:lipopolysaccharide biosynthesis glycosyltransferase
MYTTDDRYLEIMLTSLHSLVVNSKLDKIRLHIVTQNCNIKHFDMIKRFVDQYDNIELHLYRLEDNPIDSYNIPNWRGSQIANARLFYPRIIKGDNSNVTNLLYIDSDTLVVDDLSQLKNYSGPINACLDDSIQRKYIKNNLCLNKYYNSGVLYFNVEDYLDLDMEYRIKDYLSSESSKYLKFPDQDLLNILLKDELSTLPPRYNFSAFAALYKGLDSRLFFNDKIRQVSYKLMNEERKNPVILHSYGLTNIKPWHNNTINPFNELFMEHMKFINSDFKKEELEKLKKLLTLSPTLFKYMFLFRSYLPDDLQKLLTINTLKLIRNKKES